MLKFTLFKFGLLIGSVTIWFDAILKLTFVLVKQ